MKRNIAVPTTALASLALTACGPFGADAGGMACTEYTDLSMEERTEAFADAVSDRGFSYAGPDWQEDMRVAMANSHCQQRPSDTLDDALDFVGVPQ